MTDPLHEPHYVGNVWCCLKHQAARQRGEGPSPTFAAVEVCEVPGCNRAVQVLRRQRSGDVLRVCGEPHVNPGWARVESGAPNADD